MRSSRSLFSVIAGLASLLAAAGLLAACGQAGGRSAWSAPAEVVRSPLPTATLTPAPALAPSPVPASVELVVLHNNDNWGETEPCG